MNSEKPTKKSFRVIHGDLPTQLADIIGRRILMGELKPGEQLPPETEFLAEAGVSRTTMREAFKLLSSKGLVEAKPKLGTRVRESKYWQVLDPTVLGWQFDSKDDFHELLSLFEVRRLIEPESAFLAATRGSQAKLAAIGAAYEKMAEASVAQISLIESDVGFHIAILNAAGNKYLSALGTVIEMAIKSTVRVSRQRPGGLRHALPLHKAILEAIVARRPDVAKAHMRALIDDAQEDVKQLIGRAKKANERVVK